MAAFSIFKRPPTEAALPVTVIHCHRQLKPILSDPKPGLFIERTERLGCLLSGFLSLLAEPVGVV
jgi:hypothetical protein